MKAEKSARYQAGMKVLDVLAPEAMARVLESLSELAPDLGRFVVEFAYGDIYSRPGLDLKSRQVGTVAALAALGNAHPQLKFHIGAGLNAGCRPEELVEIAYLVTVFAGFPAAINSLTAMEEVFAENGIAFAARPESYKTPDRRERGRRALEAISGTPDRTVIDRLTKMAPDLGDFILDFAYGDVLARKALSLRHKELAVVAACTARGTMRPQLKVHVKGALNVGVSRAELVELFMQMAVYAGFPAALNGLFAAKEVFDKEPQ